MLAVLPYAEGIDGAFELFSEVQKRIDQDRRQGKRPNSFVTLWATLYANGHTRNPAAGFKLRPTDDIYELLEPAAAPRLIIDSETGQPRPEVLPETYARLARSALNDFGFDEWLQTMAIPTKADPNAVASALQEYQRYISSLNAPEKGVS